MGKVPKFTNESLKDDGFGIGMNDERELNSFPIEQLAEKTAARRRQEEEIDYAVDHSDEDLDDVSDLDD
jgi:hypothetical protein